MTPRAIAFLPCILKRIGEVRPFEPNRNFSAVPRGHPDDREEHRKIALPAWRQPCEIRTRLMRYHQRLSLFTIGKKGDSHERQYLSERAAQFRD